MDASKGGNNDRVMLHCFKKRAHAAKRIKVLGGIKQNKVNIFWLVVSPYAAQENNNKTTHNVLLSIRKKIALNLMRFD